MAEFKAREILRVTEGKLLQGNLETTFQGVSTDSRSLKPGSIFIALKGENFDGHHFVSEALAKGAKGAIVERPVRREENSHFCIFQVTSSLSALRKIAAYHRQRFSLPIVAITGSNGKTTLKELVYHLLSPCFTVLKTPYNYNNEIGLALTLLELNPVHQVAVLELGINHVGEMERLREMVKPEIAVFTNIGKTHLEFLENPWGVLKEKIALLRHFNKKNTAVFNSDDPLLRKWFLRERRKFSLISFGIEEEADFRGRSLILSDKEIRFRVKAVDFALPLVGRHNVYNVLAAISTGSIFGISLKEMALSLKDFHPPRMRMNVLRINQEGKKFILIDDTYNANPQSVISALESFSYFKASGKKVLILGDMLELGSWAQACHEEIALFLREKKIDILLTFGKYTQEIGKIVISSGKIREVRHFTTHAEIIEFLKENIDTGDVLLVKGSRLMHMEKVVQGILSEERVSVI
ncbi:MAG: UDP-N-acetylmuramoyl-tripeptide--D-alanyl-D-alanine ligase [Candidatus Omnitrophica bacterium]|nr:UDP-N-acetylmuramoyl-tripeptide--D-alanyl-D-alanine ligase [Candidatus Omnitrophota bacterium]MCM8798460.1 UDP-N-acetylmuramoyl-tripeptide--D-alanyl-D-alanine ligase [Candidatus Omnitrophota bacterium]